MDPITQQIAQELSVNPQQIDAAVRLLDEGSTVPFIARYRKEVTGSLSDTQLRDLEERLQYLRELTDRKKAVLKSIEEQGKLTPELSAAIIEADSKVRLEDLYRPYRPKRRTKAQIAREAGLGPLAETLLSDPSQNPEQLAETFIDPEKGVADAKAALDGARQILMEEFAENAELLGELREYLWQHGRLVSKVTEGKEQEGHKFTDYFAYEELIHKIPSHRVLALLRGRREGVLQLSLVIENLEGTNFTPCEQQIARHFKIHQQQRPADAWLLDTVHWAWRVKILTHLELELINKIREVAEKVAIDVFAENLRDLLLKAPAGPKAVMGLDPGLRTGVKVAVVDETGKLLATTTIYPHPPRQDWKSAIKVLADLCKKHNVKLISIGNGTASRETDRLAADLMQQHPELHVNKIVVSEAGASVYSASALAANEFPDLDVTLRGAVSIARRLQDPLAELVKIDPKAIGVGQYQHDVSQVELAQHLDKVVEDCVNAVGVDLNTASVPLLKSISGLNETLARNIVAYREQNGPFPNRVTLKKVTRFGEKTFEQAAGFLRIMQGDNPLDASTVHPEAYPVVERILQKLQKNIKELIGNKELLRKLNPTEYVDETFGVPTIADIIAELEKPGRDPRPEFKMATFKEGVETLADLKVGMILEGCVSNVTDFGAFVDIGVHQDGLVHISALADKFVKDPRSVVKTGDIVKVKVIEIDIARKRISLSMRLTDDTSGEAKAPSFNKTAPGKQQRAPKPPVDKGMSALGQALVDAMKKGGE